MIKNYIPLLLLLLIIIPNITISQANTTKEQLPKRINSDFTLTKNTTYIVDDIINISNGAILHIEEGVILQSTDSSNITFIITEGSRVIASGSYTNPIKTTTQQNTSEQPIIVMTSSLTKDNTTNQFRYKSIDNPTILMSQQPFTNTVIGSVDSTF